MKHECPHCGQACMSSLQKLIISPSSSVSCQACGKRISVRWRHSLALLIPSALALLAVKAYGLEPLQILLLGLVLVVIAGIIQLLFVPLSQDRT